MDARFETQPQWAHRSIPCFDQETAQEWVEAIERSIQAVTLTRQAGMIADNELASILEESLRHTRFIARAQRNTLSDLSGRVRALEERTPWWRALLARLQRRVRGPRAEAASQNRPAFMRIGQAPLDPPGHA